MKKILPLLLLTPTLANAECTPAPDCASIGYTQTSCETISLKCPFDQSKLYCFPCDSSYQYSCAAPNEYGDGESCNNKYKSCCNTDCVVGAIYYSVKTCASCLDTTKIPIGVVVKDNELVISLIMADMYWTPDRIDIADLPTITDSATALADFSGKENTATIVAHYGETSNRTTNAAVFCHTQTPVGLENSKGQWYLPAEGELFEYVYKNFALIKNTWNSLGISLPDYYIWSSTEQGAWGAWIVKVDDGSVHERNLDNNCSVTCMMSIK